MIKMIFINSGNDNDEAGNANIASFPPLGIISMASMVREKFPKECQVILLDGQLKSLEEVKKQIRKEHADVVLVSMYCTGIHYSLECIKEGHACGAITVLGNDHAKAHYNTLLNKIPEIDLISLDEFGEFLSYFLADALLNGKSVYEIPNIVYKNKAGVIIFTKKVSEQNKFFMKNPFTYIPLPDRTLLKEDYWNSYLCNFQKVKGKFIKKDNATGVTTINRARGCVNSRHRCSYCGIGDLNLYTSSPESFWMDIKNAQKDIRANFFYECFDNFTYSKKYMKEILSQRPKDLSDVNLIVYSSADRIDKENCDILHDLGVYLVNLGLDSGDEYGLKVLKGANANVEDNYRAADLLTKNNFEMHISFVLMGLGSNEITKKSMNKTMEFIKYLVKNTSISILDCALFYPDKTAPVGGLIWNPHSYDLLKEKYALSYIDKSYLNEIHERWKNVVYIDSAEITKDFAKLCGTSYGLLLEYQEQIKELCEKYKISFGYSQAGKIE